MAHMGHESLLDSDIDRFSACQDVIRLYKPARDASNTYMHIIDRISTLSPHERDKIKETYSFKSREVIPTPWDLFGVVLNLERPREGAVIETGQRGLEKETSGDSKERVEGSYSGDLARWFSTSGESLDKARGGAQPAVAWSNLPELEKR
ncbi:hypothetical protein CDL15_Pgr023983 [Punica granatum]|uniref:Uncharacterized protein n=1 Tax=Punica granatum TaxID=22663 RepID=A0A218XW34_PUNGR|nr:hypothetical protein CDL15_Pgr023983 [Punica granatum]PKI59708.1 hypothetical protein CRG98_019884 [Punica granatum]